MFNDALDQAYTDTAMTHKTGVYFHVTDTVRGTTGLNKGMNRQNIYVARFSEAFARASTGTAYVVMLNNNGDPVINAHGQPGIFQTPTPPDLNRNPNPNQHVFGINELPTLQRNVSTILRTAILSIFPVSQ